MGIRVVGVGPGDSELITVKAVREIKEADIIITPVKKEGSKDSTALKIASPYIEDFTKVHYLYFPMVRDFFNNEEVLDLYKKHGEYINSLEQGGKKVVLITLGDPSVYATFSYIIPYLNNTQVTPGIPSFIQAGALTKSPLCLGEESFCVVNMTDSVENLRVAFNLHKNIVIMKVSANQTLLKQLLAESDRSITLMSNIGLDNEHITDDIDALNNKLPYFTTGIVK